MDVFNSFTDRTAANFTDRNHNGRLEFSEFSSRVIEELRREIAWSSGPMSDAAFAEIQNSTPEAVRASYLEIQRRAPNSFPNGVEVPTDRQVGALIQTVRDLAADAHRGGGRDEGRLAALAKSVDVQGDMISAAAETVVEDAKALAARFRPHARERQ